MISSLKVQAGLCCLLLSSFASAKIHYPCSGVPGSFRTNPDNSSGGFVATTATVDSTVVLGPEASVCERATVLEGAKILDRSVINGGATIRGLVEISEAASVSGNSYLVNFAGSPMIINGSSKIYGRAYLQGSVAVGGSSQVFGWAKIVDFAQVLGASAVCGSSVIKNSEVLIDDQSHCIQCNV